MEHIFDDLDAEKIFLSYSIFIIQKLYDEGKIYRYSEQFQDAFRKWFIKNSPLGLNDEELEQEAKWTVNAMMMELDNYIQKVSGNRDELFKGTLK